MLHLSDHDEKRLGELCAEFGVRRLELVGSGLTDDFDPAKSDVDFIIEFGDPGSRGAFMQYMGLKLEMESLLGRPVDLIELSQLTNPYLIRSLTERRKSIYAA